MISRFNSPVANLLNFSATSLWWDPSINSGHTHLTKDRKSVLARFCIFFSACSTWSCLKVLRTSAGNFEIFTVFKSIWYQNVFNPPGPLNQAIKSKAVGPLFKKGGSVFHDRSRLRLGLVPLLAGRSPAPGGGGVKATPTNAPQGRWLLVNKLFIVGI